MSQTDLIKRSFDDRYVEVGLVMPVAVARDYGVVGVLGEAQEIGIAEVRIAPLLPRSGHVLVTVRRKGRDRNRRTEGKGIEGKGREGP